MGTTYSNCQVRANSQEAVVAALTTLLKELAYVSPSVGGWVGVYPEGGATDTDTLAERLSASLACGVFSWNVYDSDVFMYSLYENGKLRDEFNSDPEWGTDPNDEDAPPPNAAERKRVRGRPEALVQYCMPGIGYSAVQEVLQPPLSTVPDEDLPPGPMMAEKHLLMFAKALKTTPDAMREEWKQLARRKYQFAEAQAGDLAKLFGIAEELDVCRYRDIAEANGNFAGRQFRLVGDENLSQEYKDKKIMHGVELMRHPEQMQEWLEKGANPNARNNVGVPVLFQWAEVCFPEQVEILLKAGADVNAVTDGRGRWECGVTALMVAAGRSYEQPNRVPDTVKLLLEAGADVNARSESGRTALREALVMTDGAEHQGKIGRHAPEEVLQAAAERSTRVVEILRAAGATE